jgi:hypothetical protein
MKAVHEYELQGGGYGAVVDDVELKGAGWVSFAAVMLGLAGIWNFVDGMLAIFSSHVYTANAVYVFSDLNTWGWIVMILGVVQGLAAVSLVSGSEFGRWFGIGAAGLNAIGQLGFMTIYPFWGIAMFSLDVLIIYALAVYGGKRLKTAV